MHVNTVVVVAVHDWAVATLGWVTVWAVKPSQYVTNMNITFWACTTLYSSNGPVELAATC